MCFPAIFNEISERVHIFICAFVHTIKLGVGVHDGDAAVADVHDKRGKRREQFVFVAVSIRVVGFYVEHYGDVGLKREKTSFILAGFGYEKFVAFIDKVAGVESVAADVRREKFSRFPEYFCEHRRNGGFTVRSRNRHDGVVARGDLCEKIIAPYRFHVVFSARFEFRVACRYRLRIHDEIGKLNYFLVGAHVYVSPPFGKCLRLRGIPPVGARHGTPAQYRQLGERGHAYPAYPDKMYSFYTVPEKHTL